MASVRDTKVTETLLTLFFAYNVMKRVDSLKLRHYGFHMIWGTCFASEFSYFP